MKKYQFEEVTFWLSLIACLLAYNAQIEWLTNILVVVSAINFICAVVLAYVDVKQQRNKLKNNGNKCN